MTEHHDIDLTGIWTGNGIWGDGTRLELTTQGGRTIGWAAPADGPREPLVVYLDGSTFRLGFPSASENTCEPCYSGEVIVDGVLRGECCNQLSQITPFEFRRVAITTKPITPTVLKSYPGVIKSVDEAKKIYAQVLGAAERTTLWLRGFAGSPLELFTALRFQQVGHDPLTGMPLNVIEQLNQTFTILVSLRAVEWLIEVHPEANGFHLALATRPGHDIKSVEPGLVTAEVFAATHPGSNQKLKKDIARLAAAQAGYRYVFFAAPRYSSGRHAELETMPGVEVHCVEL